MHEKTLNFNTARLDSIASSPREINAQSFFRDSFARVRAVTNLPGTFLCCISFYLQIEIVHGLPLVVVVSREDWTIFIYNTQQTDIKAIDLYSVCCM